MTGFERKDINNTEKAHSIVLEQLRSDPHILNIKEGLTLGLNDFTVSETIPKDVAENIQAFLESAINYLNCHTIEDDFTDHLKRREWRSTMSRDLYDAYAKNRLNLNNLSSVQMYMEHYILPLCQGKLHNPALEEQLTLFASTLSEMIFEKNYDDYTIQGKISIADDFAEICMRVINLFIENHLVIGERV